MISPRAQTNLRNAEQYFEEHLNSGDYYDTNKRTPGVWVGKAAAELGLSGAVQKEDFLALCEGQKPRTGERLTARHNTVREGADGGTEANRRIFYDFTISPPKSVSVAALVHGDERISTAHREAILVASNELERFAAVRVRSKDDPLNGRDRLTGNLVAAVFDHDTSRAVDGKTAPDPHLHSHVVVFNATRDGGDWKALQNYEMLRAQKYVEAVYYHELSRSLHSLGYETRDTANGFELTAVSQTAIDTFSKRHQAIQAKTAELVANGAKSSPKNLAEAVAHDDRIRKQPNHSADALRSAWIEQLPERERALETRRVGEKEATPAVSATEALAWSRDHLFERAAVVRDVDVLNHSLRRLRGSEVGTGELWQQFQGDHELLRDADGRRVTTRTALRTETFILNAVRDGKGRYAPLGGEKARLETNGSKTLNEKQRVAAETILDSRDFLTVFRGGAGVGKSYTLRSVRDSIEADGGKVAVLAPQNQQVQDLARDGFANAQTVSAFLQSRNVPRGAVLLVDEAGQIGGKDFAALVSKAQLHGCRIIASGDTRQHGAVAASDALLAIERYAYPTLAEIRADKDTIQRQKVGWYRHAVAFADKGQCQTAFDELDKAGAVREVAHLERQREAASLFLEKAGAGKTALVISQTNVEVRALNASIRDGLRAQGQLGADSWRGDTLRARDCTDAEKQLPATYAGEALVVANRRVKGLGKGQEARFVAAEPDGAVRFRKADGHEFTVAKEHLSKLTVCERETLDLASGDRLQLRANLRLDSGKLANGQLVTLEGVDKDGALSVRDDHGRSHRLPADFRQFQRGYAVTSYASQGKTVDWVIDADAGCKAASNQKEFYVSISRGREGLVILTSDKEAMRDHVSRLGERELARDLRIVGANQFREASGALHERGGKAAEADISLEAAVTQERRREMERE